MLNSNIITMYIDIFFSYLGIILNINLTCKDIDLLYKSMCRLI